MNTHVAEGQYPLYALINRFEGSVNAEALFRTLSNAGKVRFAMNVHDILFVQIPKLPTTMVVKATPVAQLEVGDEVEVMSSVEVSVLLAFVFGEEGRADRVLPKKGQIHLLCEGADTDSDFTIVIFWNKMRRAWEMQKFEGSHKALHMTEHGFLFGPSARAGLRLAVAA